MFPIIDSFCLKFCSFAAVNVVETVVSHVIQYTHTFNIKLTWQFKNNEIY